MQNVANGNESINDCNSEMINKKSKTVLALGGLTVLASACGSTDKSASSDNNGDEKSLKTIKVSDRKSLEKRLKKLTEVRYDTTELPIAMCYSMAAPMVENYVCPVCGAETESTTYQNGNIRSIRSVFESIKNIGYDVILDEKEFCHKCNGKKSDYPSLIFKIRFSPDEEYHVAHSNVYDDYSTLLTFLASEKKDNFIQSVGNNKKEAEKAFYVIEKMTGLTIDKKCK